MHELSIAMSILDIASQESERRGGVTVHAVHIKLGELSGVVKDALLSAFELAREQSPFAHARLIVEDVPVVVHCDSCGADQPVTSIQQMSCSRCGALSANVVSGKELEITAMEIQDDNPAG